MFCERLKKKGPKGLLGERKHGLSAGQVPVSAYVGSAKNPKDLKRQWSQLTSIHFGRPLHNHISLLSSLVAD